MSTVNWTPSSPVQILPLTLTACWKRHQYQTYKMNTKIKTSISSDCGFRLIASHVTPCILSSLPPMYSHIEPNCQIDSDAFYDKIPWLFLDHLQFVNFPDFPGKWSPNHTMILRSRSCYNNGSNCTHCQRPWIVWSYSSGGIHMYPMVPLAYESLPPKRHLKQFSHFCRACPCDQHTD